MGRRAVYQDAQEPAQLLALKVDATPVVMTQNAKAIRTVSNNAVVMNICPRKSKCVQSVVENGLVLEFYPTRMVIILSFVHVGLQTLRMRNDLPLLFIFFAKA